VGGALTRTLTNMRVFYRTVSGTVKVLIAFRNGGTTNDPAIFFAACGPMIIQDGVLRKRNAPFDFQAQANPVSAPSGAGGDPHLRGPFGGIKLDVFGKPNANYSLLVAPAFEVNMQVAQFGPELRYMTRMSVLYHGKSISFDGWALLTRKAELIKHFESLNATIKIDGWVMTIDLCPNHQLKFVAMHSTDGSKINFLDIEVRVPGCHNAYGGLLGQTYQCKYLTERFDWSRDMEESFRVPTLETPSGSYSPAAQCAHEDDYQGAPVRGTATSIEGVVTMAQRR
jgi:hypothetical protein